MIAVTKDQTPECNQNPRKIFISEWFALLMLLFTLLLSLLLDTNIYLSEIWFLYGGQLLAVFYGYVLILLLIFIGIGCHIGLHDRRAGKKSSEREIWQEFRSRFFNAKEIFADLRLFNTILIVLAAFGHLKDFIPQVNNAVYDQVLLDFERWIFGGVVAFQVLDYIIPRGAAEALSVCYTAYYVYLSFIVSVMVLQRKRKLADEFCLAFGLLWFVCILVVYIMPTWGPCFFVPEIYSVLPMTKMTVMQSDLWAMKQALDSQGDLPDVFYWISGLPSLHLAVTILGSIYLAKISRTLAALSWFFAGVTVLTTLYFGWHYVLDDAAAVLLVVMVIPIARAAIMRNGACA